MGIDDHLFRQALGSRRADIVHAQRVDHRRADIARHAAQVGEGRHDQRQAHVVQLILERRKARERHTGGLHAANREDLQLHREKVNEDEADDVNRDAVTDDGDHLYGLIEFAVFPNRAENAQRNRDHQRQNGRENIEEDGVLQRRGDDVHHVLLVHRRVTEIALEYAVKIAVYGRVNAQPAQIADKDRIIQAESRAGLLVHLLILVSSQLISNRFKADRSRIARNQIVDEVHDERNDKKYDDHISHSFGNVFRHVIIILSL